MMGWQDPYSPWSLEANLHFVYKQLTQGGWTKRFLIGTVKGRMLNWTRQTMNYIMNTEKKTAQLKREKDGTIFYK